MKSQGLTAITIENFKGIGQAVTIPLRPVTLLFGANSAGKSTIIQALQYAWEILENRNADVANDKTTWTRLSQRDCDDALREFDPASSPHAQRHRFTLLQ